MKGIYKQVADIMRGKLEQSPVIDAKKMKDLINVPAEDYEQVFDEWKSFVIAIVAASLDLRASVKGAGLYVDVQNIQNTKIWKLILNNINTDVAKKQLTEEKLIGFFNKFQTNEIPGQFAFVPVGPVLDISEEATDAEIISELRRVAV